MSIANYGMLVLGLMATSFPGANCLAQDSGKKTRGAVIGDDMLVASDQELREHVEEIVFVRGVIDYDPRDKKPSCSLTSTYGITYECSGMQEFAGDEVILAAVPRLQTPGTVPSEPAGAIKRVYFTHARVIAIRISRGSVEKLVTSNAPATIRGNPGREEATWDKVDLEESGRVRRVADLVVRRSEELWSELVEHLDDRRYSMTVGIDAGYPRNCSVGDMCQKIIGSTLSEAYYRHLPGTKEDYHRFSIPDIAKDKSKLYEWCMARKDQKLFELQIEVCEWAIAEINASEMSLKEKQRITTAIKKEIDELAKSRVAIRCKSLF